MIGEMPSGVMAPGACAEWTAMDFKCMAQDHIDAMLWRHAETYPHDANSGERTATPTRRIALHTL